VLKIFISSWILLSSAAFAKGEVSFIKKAGPGCAHMGIVEGTFGKEIYDSWSRFDIVHVQAPASAMDSMANKAISLGGNRIVITEVRPLYLSAKNWTHGDLAPHTVTSLAAVTIQGAVYACN
jgi:hypothetical protein